MNPVFLIVPTLEDKIIELDYFYINERPKYIEENIQYFLPVLRLSEKEYEKINGLIEKYELENKLDNYEFKKMLQLVKMKDEVYNKFLSFAEKYDFYDSLNAAVRIGLIQKELEQAGIIIENIRATNSIRFNSVKTNKHYLLLYEHKNEDSEIEAKVYFELDKLNYKHETLIKLERIIIETAKKLMKQQKKKSIDAYLSAAIVINCKNKCPVGLVNYARKSVKIIHEYNKTHENDNSEGKIKVQYENTITKLVNNFKTDKDISKDALNVYEKIKNYHNDKVFLAGAVFYILNHKKEDESQLVSQEKISKLLNITPISLRKIIKKLERK